MKKSYDFSLAFWIVINAVIWGAALYLAFHAS